MILWVDTLGLLDDCLESHNDVVEGVTFQDQVGDDCVEDDVI